MIKTVQCIRTAGDGADELYARIHKDGRFISQWPHEGHVDMNVGDKVHIDRPVTFNKTARIELWEYDSGSGDDYLKDHTIKAGGKGEKRVKIHSSEEGSLYELRYEYLPKKVKTVRLLSAKCIRVANGTDAGVISAAFKMAGKASAVAGQSIGMTLDPKMAMVGAALEAGSKVFLSVPGMVEAIDRAGQYPDQLYMTRTNQSGVQRRCWPPYGTYKELRSGQIERFDNLRFILSDPVDINIWEYDSGSGDDHLGFFTIESGEPDKVHFKSVAHPTEGSLYMFAYLIRKEAW